jgi:hypothetical protein
MRWDLNIIALQQIDGFETQMYIGENQATA